MVTLLLLIGTCPLNVISLDFSRDVFTPYCFVVLCKVYNTLCIIRLKSTWSSPNNSVLNYCVTTLLHSISLPLNPVNNHLIHVYRRYIADNWSVQHIRNFRWLH